MIGIGIGMGFPFYGGGGVPLPFPTPSWLVSRVVTGDPDNIFEQTDQTFAPTAVDTSGNIITLSPDPGYAAYIDSRSATRVYFSSTGTLPSPLQANTPYYLSPSGGGYGIYPETGANDYLNLRNMLAEEKPMPAQNYVQLGNRIVLTTQGTGIHRIYSANLLKRLKDKIFTDYYFEYSATDRHQRYELVTANGKEAIEQRILFRDPAETGGYNLYGQSRTAVSATGATGYNAWQNAALRNKRVTIVYAVVSWDETDTYGLFKVPIVPAGVNTSTGVLTTAATLSAGMTTGFRVQVRVYPGGTLPTGYAPSTDYYIRVTSGTFTLHPTSGDATGNTNVIIPSTQGTEGFTIVAVESGGDQERMRFVSEIRDAAGNNTITARTNFTLGGEISHNMGTDVYTGAATVNCRVGFTGRTMQAMLNSSNSTYIKVRFRMSPGGTRPTCVDTGLALADGEYWITKDIGSSVFVRLHRTLADAIAATGVANSSLTGVIRWSSVGSGFGRFERAESRPFSVGSEAMGTEVLLTDGTLPWSPPLNTPGVLTVVIDHNDPAKSLKNIRVFWNGVKYVDSDVAASTKGNTSAALAAETCWTLMNSPQAHVPFEGLFWEMGIGATASDAVLDSDLSNLHNWLMAEYGIS